MREIKTLILLSGFKTDFSLHYSGTRIPREAINLKSENSYFLFENAEKELTTGPVIGPFVSNPIPTSRAYPLGLVPKLKNRINTG